MHTTFRVLAAIACVLHAGSTNGADDRQRSRITELTAHVVVDNDSATPVTRYVYRVTAPLSDTPFQQTKAVRSVAEPTSMKPHKNDANQYFEFQTPIGSNGKVQNTLTFNVLTIPVDYLDGNIDAIKAPPRVSQESLDRYLSPSSLVESDAPEIQNAAKSIFDTAATPLIAARSAYEYPSQALRFRLQDKALGAQKGLVQGEGDCTEHACLFAALCRTQAIPARRMAVFNFSTKGAITASEPNHDIAEVYLPNTGWIPVDANLGRGRYDRPVGFGRLSNNMIAMNREGAWVYSTWLPRDSYSQQLPKPKVSFSIKWSGRVLAEGPTADIVRRFSRIRGTQLQ